MVGESRLGQRFAPHNLSLRAIRELNGDDAIIHDDPVGIPSTESVLPRRSTRILQRPDCCGDYITYVLLGSLATWRGCKEFVGHCLSGVLGAVER